MVPTTVYTNNSVNIRVRVYLTLDPRSRVTQIRQVKDTVTRLRKKTLRSFLSHLFYVAMSCFF